MISTSILATSLLAVASLAAPLERRDDDNPNIVQGLLGTDGYWNDFDGGTNAYIEYKGDGSANDNWPDAASWISYNEMWTTNSYMIARSCDLWYDVPNNSDEETLDLYNAIKQVAHETRVDHRYILAVVLQETRGCVRAAANVSADNPGILQAYKGTHSCNLNGKVDNPCPEDTILGMIRDGVSGTEEGHGLAEDINEQADFVDNDVAQAYYRAARLYHSGSIDASNALEDGKGEHCYASDIANRLMGWTTAPRTCTLDS